MKVFFRFFNNNLKFSKIVETSHMYIFIYYMSVQALVTITYLFSFIFSNILYMYVFIHEVLILLCDINRKKKLNYMIGLKYRYEV